MRVNLSHIEYSKNGTRREVVDGSFKLSKDVERGLSKAAREYRTTHAGIVALALAYYFGDGSNHLGCCDCAYLCQGVSLDEVDACSLPNEGEQTTIPLLDKGIVVVGLPAIDQGE